MRICCNSECGWEGQEDECMDFKHPVGERLCPVCYEVTEFIPDRAPAPADADAPEKKGE